MQQNGIGLYSVGRRGNQFANAAKLFDFSGGSMPSGLTFTRASSATRINSSGLVETVTTNTPRFDYDPVTRLIKGLLIEPQRQNYYTDSNDLSTANWTFSGTTRTGAAGTAPDGTNTATRVVMGPNTYLYKNSTPANPAGSVWVNSIWVKSAVPGTPQKVRLFGNGVNSLSSAFTIGDTWQRIEFSWTLAQATSGFTPDAGGSCDVLVWGFQLELASFATSLIPTTSAPVTRESDLCSTTSVSWFSDASGTWYSEFDSLAVGSGLYSPAFEMYASGATSKRQILFSNQAKVDFFSGGGTGQAFLTAVATQQANTMYRCAASYAAPSSLAAVANGGTVATDTSTTLPASGFDTFRVGRFGPAGSDGVAFGHIKKIAYWNRQMTSGEIASLTA